MAEAAAGVESFTEIRMIARLSVSARLVEAAGAVPQLRGPKVVVL